MLFHIFLAAGALYHSIGIYWFFRFLPQAPADSASRALMLYHLVLGWPFFIRRRAIIRTPVNCDRCARETSAWQVDDGFVRLECLCGRIRLFNPGG